MALVKRIIPSGFTMPNKVNRLTLDQILTCEAQKSHQDPCGLLPGFVPTEHKVKDPANEHADLTASAVEQQHAAHKDKP
jgi:hypothetical protein